MRSVSRTSGLRNPDPVQIPMVAHCTTQQLEFESLGRTGIMAEFEDGRMTFDGGALAGGRIVIMVGPAEHGLTQPVVEALPRESASDLTGSEHLLTLPR